MKTRKGYSTAVSDYEWEVLEPLLPAPKPLGRKISYCRREIVNAIFYLVNNGCKWRDLPHDLPPYGLVSSYYHAWRKSGVWESINDTLRQKVRQAEGREAEPTAGSLDSQSVKTSEESTERGYDAGKKIKGVKRHLLVDTLGLLLIVVVHSADIQDRDGAKLVLKAIPKRFPTLKLIWADGGYAGQLIGWLFELGQVVLTIIKRTDNLVGFKLLPRRWVVERTFGWLGRWRRLAKHYERSPASGEAMVQLAMIRLMLRRLDRHHQKLVLQRPTNAAKAGFALAA
jgi:putative transposase